MAQATICEKCGGKKSKSAYRGQVCLRCEKNKEALRAAAPQLLEACKEILDGFRYVDGRPVMPEWKMKELLAVAIAAAEPEGGT